MLCDFVEIDVVVVVWCVVGEYVEVDVDEFYVYVVGFVVGCIDEDCCV